MARWQPDAEGRLQAAAFELFDERGFDETTVAEIAARAGLTRRSFFHHFPDKREVLFSGAEHFRDQVLAHIDDLPPDASPADTAVQAIRATAEAAFAGLHTAAARRQRIIEATPELQEREAIKHASLAAAIAGHLRERGVDDPVATLAAQAAVAVWDTGYARWTEAAKEAPLGGFVDAAHDALRAAVAPPGA